MLSLYIIFFASDLEVEKTILMEANNIDFDDTFSVACNACLPPKVTFFFFFFFFFFLIFLGKKKGLCYI